MRDCSIKGMLLYDCPAVEIDNGADNFNNDTYASAGGGTPTASTMSVELKNISAYDVWDNNNITTANI